MHGSDERREDVESTLKDVLQRHSVRFAVLFGSRGRGSATTQSDLDLAIEFDGLRPADAGYSDSYLSLLNDVQRATAAPSVDLVDVHSVSPRFARAVFNDGTLLVGTTERRAELASKLSGEPLSKAQACARIDAAVEQMESGQPSG